MRIERVPCPRCEGGERHDLTPCPACWGTRTVPIIHGAGLTWLWRSIVSLFRRPKG
jgi:hypothetical protein